MHCFIYLFILPLVYPVNMSHDDEDLVYDAGDLFHHTNDNDVSTNFNPYSKESNKKRKANAVARHATLQNRTNGMPRKTKNDNKRKRTTNSPSDVNTALLIGARKAHEKRTKKNDTARNLAANQHQSLTAKASAKKRNENRNAKKHKINASVEDDGHGGTWTSQTWKLLASMKDSLKEAIGFDENGKHEMYGKWPNWAYHPLSDPGSDPVNFLDVMGDDRNIEELLRSDFALPSVMFFGPELRWAHLYPDNRPMCPIHKTTNCVIHNGWSDYFRRGYARGGNVAINCRRYLCKETRKSFQSCDPEVLELAPRYVQAWWRKNGFKITYRGALSWDIIDQMRSLLAHGAGASGFYKSIVETYKQCHNSKSKMWMDHCNYSYLNSIKKTDGNRKPRQLFFDVDDLESEMRIPSLGFVLRCTLEEIESHINYYQSRLELNTGSFLSADHSHKVAKVVLIQGERGFEGVYTIMNEFGKILGFWFVNGTTLQEVEGCLRGINRRFRLRGVNGPLVFTTDRCCDEREFIAGTKNAGTTPIFATLVSEDSSSAADGDKEELQNGMLEPDIDSDDAVDTVVENPTLVEIDQLILPTPPQVPSTLELAEMTVNEIIQQCDENSWDIISIDSEWLAFPAERKRKKLMGPDVFQLGLPNGSTYVFKLRSYGSFPKSLKVILENPEIKKVASNISSDASKLGEIGISLKGAVDLGTIAKERGFAAVKNVALAKLVNTLFHCRIDKNNDIRLSDWSQPDLDDHQEEYAAIDAYAHMFCYRKMMQVPYVDPKETLTPQSNELAAGAKVLLYTSNKNSVVAAGTVVGQYVEKTPVGIDVKSKTLFSIHILQEDVRQPVAKVGKKDGKSFHDLFAASTAADGEPSKSIIVAWKKLQLRIIPVECQDGCEEVVVSTKKVRMDASSIVVEHGASAVVGGDCSRGVKQDIVHIFLRFNRVLKSAHGAYRAFLARLSDVFFVPSQQDIEFIKKVLKKNGFSDDEIKAKSWQYYKRRVRRSVPGPEILERDFARVVKLFANLEDAKTRAPLFGVKAWNLYKTTLKHIRKGCLSDVHDLTYYFQIREDSMGIPIFKCVRGTSALEGFHQKIRQLIRGFNVSPRFAVALLLEFVHRWNQDIDNRILGLPMKYANFYDGWEIEEDIELAMEWSELEETPHPHWQSTRDYARTGEHFGLIKPDGQTGDSAISEEDTEVEVFKWVDAILDGTLEDANENSAENIIASAQILTESAQWVGVQLGHSRSYGIVRTTTEIEFFRKHFLRFQNKDANEADNYCAIEFGAFARFWNEWIADECKGKRVRSDMTLKNAFQLSAYWKKFRREGNAAATLLPISSENKNMRRALRGDMRENEVTIPPAQDVHPEIYRQNAATGDLHCDSDEDPNDAFDFHGAVDLNDCGCGSSTPVVSNAKSTTKIKTRSARRCRLCGHAVGLAQPHAIYHKGSGKRGTMEQQQPNEVCTVPPGQYAKGYPLKPGQRHPRQKK
jgi:hypothetical protein